MSILRAALWATLATLAVAMVGCQGGSESSGTSGTGGRTVAKDGKRFKVGVSIPAADHGWTAGVKWWADQATKLHPDIDWIIEDAKEPGEQISDLENLQSQRVDALVILATESEPITPIAEKLKEAGILIISVDRGFTKPVADVFIEGDNKAFGRKSAQYIVEKLGGQGKIVVLEGIPSTVNTDRVNAAMEVFKANPGIQIVAKDTGMWNREKAEKVMQNILVSHPQIDAIWASDDDMALGVENALRAAGRDKNIWILGGAGMKDIVKRVMDGDPLYPADITYPPSMIAVGVQMAASILESGREKALQFMPRHLMIDVELITPENAKDYYFPDSVY
ncbi:MAG TPA: ABC transporter substrate-binding protein [Fimbriimonadaceae bacterium]|nr:ABC transporter substrate-binding protein [Fimbriimonadaceae bacterium]HRJ97288.1 ABC transporter substrate-binding protein [Fimbriimonadaceae bacterium]